MEKKKVKCPTCEAILDVKNSKGEAIKIFNCPICATKLKVVFRRELESTKPLEAHEYIEKPNDEYVEEKTTVDGLAKATHAFLNMNGKSVELKVGDNIVGRHSSSYKASVELPTKDSFMSRQHALFKVKKAGNTLVVAISNYRNLNPTYVNDKQLGDEDEIILSHGDRIKMGETTVTLILE